MNAPFKNPFEPRWPPLLTKEQWIEQGVQNSWIEKFCLTHDDIPLTDDEAKLYFESESDFCIPCLRVYSTP